MLRVEFEEKYPHTYECLKIMAFDNDIHISEEILMSAPGQVWPHELDLEGIEAQAASLNREEKDIMSDGEQTEREAFVQANDLQQLDNFLEEAFQGSLASQIWEEF